VQHCNGWWIGQSLPRAEVDGVSHLSDVGSLEVGARTARMGEVMRLTHRATWDERSFGGGACEHDFGVPDERGLSVPER
jgi:hypothetical protein